jgi:hypothetical protein
MEAIPFPILLTSSRVILPSPSSCPQALDAALKQLKAGAPNTAAMLFSVDRENNKVMCLCQVPDVSVITPVLGYLESWNTHCFLYAVAG